MISQLLNVYEILKNC